MIKFDVLTSVKISYTVADTGSVFDNLKFLNCSETGVWAIISSNPLLFLSFSEKSLPVSEER